MERESLGLMERHRLGQIWHLSWPVILEMISLLAGGFFLTAMVGQFGAVGQAAVGLTMTLQFATALVVSAAGTGAGVLVAREVGARHPEKVRELAGQALFLGIAGGVVLLLGGTTLAASVVSAAGLTMDVRLLAQEFIQISFTFIPFLVVMQVCVAVLRSIGKTKLSLFVTASNNLLMLAIAAYLLFYTPSGVSGAVLGASIAQVYGCFLGIFLLTRHWAVGLRFKDVYPLRVPVARQILHISLPAAMEQGALQGGRIFYTLMLAALGATQLAAHNIALQVESLSFRPGMAFSIAALTLVGQNLGRGLPHRAREYAVRCTQAAMIGMTGVGILFFIFAYELAGFFSSDPEVIEWAVLCIYWAATEQPTLAASLVLGGALRGTGDTRWPMLMTIIGIWGIRIPFMMVLASMGELTVSRTWIVTSADFLVRSMLLYWRFRKVKWRSRSSRG